jgi:hypothetical protein
MGSINYNITDTTNDTTDIVGLDNIKADLTLGLTQPFSTQGTNTIELKPVKADLGTDTHLAIDPLKLELKTDPIQTDSNLTLDLKPVVVDLCLTANVGKVPSVSICQPYHHRIGFSLYGTEVWGFSFSGEQKTVVEELNRQPKVSLGNAVTNWPAERHSAREPELPSPSRQASGLRIRLDK